MGDVEQAISPTARLDPRRDPSAVAQAFTARWRRYRLRAYLFGVVVGLTGTIPIVIATAVLAIALAAAGITIALPWDEVAWTIAFLIVFALSGAWAVARWLPPSFRAALESYLWLASRAEGHWADTLGTPVPRTAATMRAFLDAATVTPAAAGDIATIWLALGDLDTAREIVALMPESTDVERHRKRTTAWLIDFVGGADRSLDTIEASAAAIADETERREALVDVAIDQARVAIAHGADWVRPMAAVRPLLGTDASDVLWRFAFEPALRTMLTYGGIGVAAYWVFTFLARAT
jgi:hypothetical protein